MLGFCLVSSLSLSLLGAGCSTEEVKPEATPIVGTLELPIAHRNSDTEPGDAARIEIGTSEIRVAGETVLKLESGKIPAADRPGDVLPKLKEKLAGKKVLALTVYAASPYSTLARVINTGFEAGIHELAFRVRKPGSNTETGWLRLHGGHFVKSADDGQFGDALLPWDKFANVWEESLDACNAGSRGGDCGYKPMAKATGGKLDMMLRVRGSGLALRFRQTGAPAPVDAGVPDAAATAEAKPSKAKKGKKKPKAEMLDGIKGGGGGEAVEEAPPEPATEQVFSLRAEQAAEVPSSPISDIVKPICGSVSCPAVLESEGISMSGTVISFIAAAFPNGTPEPKLAWVLPKQ